MGRKGRDAEWASARIAALRRQPGALFFILHAPQDEFDYIDSTAVSQIAAALNVSRAEVATGRSKTGNGGAFLLRDAARQRH